MPLAIGFDVYGTLVDPLAIRERLAPLVGEGSADAVAATWRQKQVEYAFRRGLMRRYVDFDVCTRQALHYALAAHNHDLAPAEIDGLLVAYRALPAFADAAPGLDQLRAGGHHLVAFSNGVEASVRALLDHAGLLARLHGVVSVDDLHTFKPDPAVYRYLAERLNRTPAQAWLVSANPWDVLGAKAAGLHAAWLRRNSQTPFDPWDLSPDIVAADLADLAQRI